MRQRTFPPPSPPLRPVREGRPARSFGRGTLLLVFLLGVAVGAGLGWTGAQWVVRERALPVPEEVLPQPTPSLSVAPPASPRPPVTARPRLCPFPGPGCAGVQVEALPLTPSLPLVITAPGVYERLDIAGCVQIQADNVTLRNSRVRAKSECASKGYSILVDGTDQNPRRGILFEDVEIDGRDPGDGSINAFGAGVGVSGFTCRRCDVHHVGTGFALNNDVTIEDSYVHDLYGAGDPATSGSHNDAILSNGGSRLVIRNNELFANNIGPGGGVSAAIGLFGDFEQIQDVTIEGNRLNGGSYCLYGGSSSSKPFPQASNVRIRNNRFGRQLYNRCGLFGPVAAVESELPADNVWDGTSTPVT